MIIKYHSHEIKPEYELNEKTGFNELSNNWDPDLDYGNEYVDVHFRIETPSYRSNGNRYYPGFKDGDSRDEWNKEASELIKSLGILEDSGYKVEHSEEKQAYLHAHPDSISGEIKKNDVKKIAEAISGMKLSSLEFVELYDTIYNITDEEYEEYLKTKSNQIRYTLFEKSHTSRTGKYYYLFDIARNIAGAVRLKRLGLNDGRNYGSGQTIEYIINTAKELANDGYVKIVQDKNGYDYIRSLNKTEFKKAKLKPLEMGVCI